MLKQIFASISILLFPVFVLAQGNKNQYTVKGKIEGANNVYIYLRPSNSAGDSVLSQNGEFEFKGRFTETCIASLFVQGFKLGFAVIIEPGIIEVAGKANDMNNATAKGGIENTVYNEFRLIVAKSGNEFRAIMKSISDAKKVGDSILIKRYNDEWNEWSISGIEKREQFIRKYPKSFTALYICRNHTVRAPEVAFKYLSLVDKSLHKHSVYKEVKNRAEIEQRIVIGKPAPDFKQPLSTNGSFKLSSLKGKYVLVDFWASWCIPCRQESPNLMAAYKAYKDKGLEIVSISLDENKDKWLDAIQKDGYNWINVSDLKGFKNAAAILYGVSAIPRGFLIDKEGKLIEMDLRGGLLNEKLKALF